MPTSRSELEVLRAVIDTQQAIASHLDDPQRVMAIVTHRTQDLTGVSGAVVEMLEGDEMVYRAVSGSAEGSLGLRLAAATSLSGRCVAEGRPLRCDDSETDPRVDRDACRRVGVRSMIVVPLQVAPGDCVGVLKVLSPEPAGFDEGDLGTLSAMAEYIATSLLHAREFEDLDRRVRHDALTGLANRAAVLEGLAVALARARRTGGDVTLLFLDLDGFKQVNDTLGHEAGDRVLVEVGRSLLANVRANDLVGRLGGDEFVVVCEDLADDDVDDLLDRLGEVVQASVGVARSAGDDSADTLLARADEAMYERKRARRA